MTAKNRLLTYLFSKLTQSEKNVIKGEQVGLASMLEDYNIGFFARQHHLGHSITGDEGDELVEVSHKSSLFMLMMSKDDNLMLQMGGLISILADCPFLTPELK